MSYFVPKSTNLLIVILLLFITFDINAQNRYEYNIVLTHQDELPLKEVYAHLMQGLDFSNRYIQEDGSVKFKSSEMYDKSIFEIRALDYGIDTVNVFVQEIKEGQPSAPKLGGQDCEDAYLVCNNQSFSGNSNGFATQELNGTNRGCIWSNETQTSWYYVNVGTGGTLGMTITPDNGTDDYDFAIWGPFTDVTAAANCPPVSAPLRCNWALYPWSGFCGTNTNPTGLALNASLPLTSNDCQDRPFLRHLDVNPGEIYILMIDNYSGSTQPFNLDWSGTAGLECTAVPLPVSLIDFSGHNNLGENSINWSTASERDNDFFRVERSTDGYLWYPVADVKGSGTTNAEQSYSIKDANIENNIMYYYRLKQFDYDGKMETHDEIVAILNNHAKPQLVRVINSLGQEVKQDAKGLIFEIYSDGSRVKKFNP
jgi:hypothetical protein